MDAKEFRDLGHKTVDLLASYLEQIEEKRVFPDVEPQIVNRLFSGPLPEAPSASDTVLTELEEKLLPYCTNVGHPGYMGLITPSPTPVGIIADFICSALNQNVGAYSIGPSAVAMEKDCRPLAHRSVWFRQECRGRSHQRRHVGEFYRPEGRARCRDS